MQSVGLGLDALSRRAALSLRRPRQDMPASMEIGQLNDSIEALRSAQHYTSSDSETINHTQSKPKNMRSLMSSTSNIFDGDVKKASLIIIFVMIITISIIIIISSSSSRVTIMTIHYYYVYYHY